jgi:hypothetical protein
MAPSPGTRAKALSAARRKPLENGYGHEAECGPREQEVDERLNIGGGEDPT